MRRQFTLLLFLLMLLIISACGGGGGDNARKSDNTVSTLCPGITGAEAIIWDFYNGIIRTDVDVLPPAVPTGGGSFMHTANPLLSFLYPAGWNATQIGDSIHTVGVDVIRLDMQAVWRELNMSANGAPTALSVRDSVMNELLQFLTLQNAPIQTLCTNEGTTPVGGGITLTYSHILFRASNQTVYIGAAVTPLPGLPTSTVRMKVAAAPTDEFKARAIDTFLAIDWQMLIGDSQNLIDSDGDGWHDGIDNFKFDPTKH